MSSSLLIQTKDRCFIGADRAISSFDGNSSKRIGEISSKIFVFENYIFFCSGELKSVINFLEFVDKSNEFSVDKISKFLKKNIKNKKKDNKFFDIEILAIDNSTKIVYQISQYKNFDVETYIPDEKNTRILSAGFKTREIIDIAEEQLMEKINVKDIYINTFNKISCEEIGSMLDIYYLEKTIKKYYSGNVSEDVYLNNSHFLKNSLHLIVADALVGRMIAGNSLTITNEGSNFTVDKDGCRLNNASFIIQNSKTAILLSPVDGTLNGLSGKGITIQSKAKGYWEKVFYADTEGNLIIKGGITADFGSFGGWTINEDGISDTHGNYINSTGKVKLGGLTIDGTSARFNGDIYANTFHGKVVGGDNILPKAITPEHIDHISADSITTGSLSADRIYGGVFRGPGGIEISLGVTSGYVGVSANDGVRLFVNGGTGLEGVLVNSRETALTSKSTRITGTTLMSGDLETWTLGDELQFPRMIGKGLTRNIVCKNSAGINQTLNFSKGILIGVNGAGDGGTNVIIPPAGGISLVWDKTTISGTDTVRSTFANYTGVIQPPSATNPTYITLNLTYFDDAKTNINFYGLDSNNSRIITGDITPPTTTGSTYVRFSNLYPVQVVKFEIEINSGGSSSIFIPGAEVSRGTVDGNNSSGIDITTIQGELYAIENILGPYNTRNGDVGWNVYSFQVNMSGMLGLGHLNNETTFYLTTPTGCLFSEAVSGTTKYARTYFVATSTSVNFRVNDFLFSDNRGSLDYILRTATQTGRSISTGLSYIFN